MTTRTKAPDNARTLAAINDVDAGLTMISRAMTHLGGRDDDFDAKFLRAARVIARAAKAKVPASVLKDHVLGDQFGSGINDWL